MRGTQAEEPACPKPMLRSGGGAALGGGCKLELWTKMVDNNTARHIEAKNAPSEGRTEN